tara:strand:- start:172 stop:519 length:348 start_codon:yes stop_codon:yes gene_type:complete
MDLLISLLTDWNLLSQGVLIGASVRPRSSHCTLRTILRQSYEAHEGWLGLRWRSICGEHGGDPESVKFCHRTGLNYVSCSPFRIPIAKLAAAQTALADKPAKAAPKKKVAKKKTV